MLVWGVRVRLEEGAELKMLVQRAHFKADRFCFFWRWLWLTVVCVLPANKVLAKHLLSFLLRDAAEDLMRPYCCLETL